MPNPFDVIGDEGRKYISDAFGGSLTPEITAKVLRQGTEAASMTPTLIGDIASALLTADALRRGKYAEAAGNAIGILPFIPGMTKAFRDIPLPHGTAPLKEDHVRLYHQTDAESLKAIENEGLLLSKAKGIEGPKAIYAGEKPFYGPVDSRPTLEFQVPKNMWDSPFVLRNVTKDDIIAAHYPWHRKARYLEEPGNEVALGNALSGKFDNLTGDYAEAVKFIKSKYEKGGK